MIQHREKEKEGTKDGLFDFGVSDGYWTAGISKGLSDSDVIGMSGTEFRVEPYFEAFPKSCDPDSIHCQPEGPSIGIEVCCKKGP